MSPEFRMHPSTRAEYVRRAEKLMYVVSTFAGLTAAGVEVVE